MERREFLKQAGASAVVGAVAAPFVQASDKSGSKPVVIGKGARDSLMTDRWRGRRH